MKAISVKQPWANLIASGAKTVETRTWATAYRGELLIVSSRTPRIEPAGKALAIAELVECRPMTKADETSALCDVYPNAHAWILRRIRRIRPFPVKGQLGIYDVDVTGLVSPETPQPVMPRISSAQPKRRAKPLGDATMDCAGRESDP